MLVAALWYRIRMIFEHFRRKKEEPPLTRAQIDAERAEIQRQLDSINERWEAASKHDEDGTPANLRMGDIAADLRPDEERLTARLKKLNAMKGSDEQ